MCIHDRKFERLGVILGVQTWREERPTLDSVQTCPVGTALYVGILSLSEFLTKFIYILWKFNTFGWIFMIPRGHLVKPTCTDCKWGAWTWYSGHEIGRQPAVVAATSLGLKWLPRFMLRFRFWLHLIIARQYRVPISGLEVLQTWNCEAFDFKIGYLLNLGHIGSALSLLQSFVTAAKMANFWYVSRFHWVICFQTTLYLHVGCTNEYKICIISTN